MSIPLEDLREPIIERTLLAVTNAFGISRADLLGTSQAALTAEARFASWAILRDEGVMTSRIARAFNRSNTGTIRHGYRRTQDLITACPKFSRCLLAALVELKALPASAH